MLFQFSDDLTSPAFVVGSLEAQSMLQRDRQRSLNSLGVVFVRGFAEKSSHAGDDDTPFSDQS